MRLVQVTPVYVPPTVTAIRMTLSANQSIPSGGWTYVDVDGVTYDTLNEFEPGFRRWRCSQTGKYLVCLGIMFEDIPDAVHLRGAIFVSGVFHTPYALATSGVSGQFKLSSSDIISVTADQTVNFTCHHNSGVNKDIKGGFPWETHLTIHRIS